MRAESQAMTKILQIKDRPFGVKVRQMVEEDLEEVIRIEQRSSNVPWKEAMFRGELEKNPYSTLWVVLNDSGFGIIAYVCFWIILEDLHILNIAVCPEERGKGLGKELIRTVLRHANQQGIREASLEVRNSNLTARKLYERLGFRAVGVRPGYYRNPLEDGIIMVLQDLDNTSQLGGESYG